MRADLERWNAKYRAAHPNPEFQPDPVLVRLCPHVSAGLALDVACGVAHNAMYLAEHGYEVIAVDGSIEALRLARERLRARPLAVHLAAVDLDRFAPPAGRFDLVVMVRYLDRALVPRLALALRPGGLIFLKTFNTHYAKVRPAFRAEYLLKPGEWRALLPDLDVIETNDSATAQDMESYVLARRRG